MAKPIGKRIGQIDDHLANLEAMIEAELANFADGTDITDYEPEFKMLQDDFAINFGAELGEDIAKKDPKGIFKQDVNTTRFF